MRTISRLSRLYDHLEPIVTIDTDSAPRARVFTRSLTSAYSCSGIRASACQRDD